MMQFRLRRIFFLIISGDREIRLLYVLLGTVVCMYIGCVGYLRSATTVVEDRLSPNGKHDAIVVAVNGGGMTGYVTGVSIVDTHSKLLREFSTYAADVIS